MKYYRPVLERDVENALKKRVKELGGICEKFTSHGRRSVPDDIITLPGGRIEFVECKAPSKKPTEKQEADHKKRLELGIKVHVIDTIEAANAFC